MRNTPSKITCAAACFVTRGGSLDGKCDVDIGRDDNKTSCVATCVIDRGGTSSPFLAMGSRSNRVGMVFVHCRAIGVVGVAETLGDLRESSVGGDFMVSTGCRDVLSTWNAVAVKSKLRRERLVSMFCGSIIMVSTGGGDLGGDGVGVKADRRLRMTSSLTFISNVLVVMVDRFWVK